MILLFVSVLVLVIHDVVWLLDWLFLFPRRLLLPLLLLVTFAIIRDHNWLYYFWYLDIDLTIGSNLGQPQLAVCRPASVFVLMVLHQVVACTELGVLLFGFKNR